MSCGKVSNWQVFRRHSSLCLNVTRKNFSYTSALFFQKAVCYKFAKKFFFHNSPFFHMLFSMKYVTCEKSGRKAPIFDR